MREDIPDSELFSKGEMTKPIWDMTPEEYKQWQIEQPARIRKRLFAIGQPMVYYMDDKLVIEYPDGRIEYRDKDSEI